VPGPAASAWRARFFANEAADRMVAGRPRPAIKLCREALAEAALATGPIAERATAHACYLYDWAHSELGKLESVEYSERAAEIYTRLGDLEDLSNVVNNLGMFAYYAGRWDEAVRLYREGGELCERIGDVLGTSYGDCNTGEVLADQGHWDEAAEVLRRAQRVWQATGFDAGVTFIRMLQGRLAARTGDHPEGLRLLTSAVAELTALGHEHVHLGGAYLAEAFAYAGRGPEAVAAVERLRAAGPGRLTPLLLRVEALGHAQEGAAVVLTGLEAALAAARAETSDFDIAITLDALCTVAALDGSGPHPDRAAERDRLLKGLGVIRLPALPAISASGASSASVRS
jgi:tetratricopeptide (TPR) repeat protein